jgi:hypothetical protein
MAVIYPMPTNVPELVSTGYQRQNTLMFAVMTGYLNFMLTEMNTIRSPKVEAGSMFEMNGGLFAVLATESIGGSLGTGQSYVYAVPYDSGATFQYATVKPVWSAAKGGWYNGNNRAVALVVRESNGSVYKTILGNLGTGEYDTVRISGENIEFWQGTTMVAQIQVTASGLVMSGLATFNDGLLSQGDIKAMNGTTTVKLVYNANGTVGWVKA